MSAYSDFEHSIASSYDLLRMYAELRASRNLGARGRLDAANQDLLWLPRSAVVASISAMDAFIHEFLYQRIRIKLRRNEISESLALAMSDMVPIKNGHTFQAAFSIPRGKNSHLSLAKMYRDNVMQYQSFQSPDKIISGFSLIGVPDIFVGVADRWAGPNTTAQNIKNRLSSYARRRNQIAHEGDRESGGAVRPMQPKYAQECTDFIRSLTERLRRLVLET